MAFMDRINKGRKMKTLQAPQLFKWIKLQLTTFQNGRFYRCKKNLQKRSKHGAFGESSNTFSNNTNKKKYSFQAHRHRVPRALPRVA